MSNLLSSIAVSRRGGEDASQILQAYVATGPRMEQNNALEAAPGQRPKGTGAGDHLVEPR